MTAFLELLDTYAIFFYIAGVLAVLFGIKMLFDARRAGRMTLFTLEQEQASDRAFRAVLVMLGATLFIAAVAGINAFVSPIAPAQETDVAEPTIVAFTPPVQLATATPQPTLTPPPATAAPATVAPTEAAVVATPVPVKPTAGVSPTPEVVEPPTPELSPEPTSQFLYLAPTLNVPPSGDSIGSDRIRMSWGVDEFGNLSIPQTLPPDQFYRLVITFTDRTQNSTSTLVLCTHENSVDQRSGVTVTEYRNEAVDNLFRWTVTAVQAPSQEACQAGDFQPVSPTSAVSTFILP